MTRYAGEEKRAKKLHLDPTISWGHILTTLMMMGTILAGWNDVNKRLTLNESASSHNRELIGIQERQSNQDRTELSHIIEKINEKLDRLIERRTN